MPENAALRLTGRRYRAWYVRRLSRDLVASWAEDPRALIESGERWPPGTRFSSVRLRTAVGDIFVKHHRRRPWKAALDALSRRASRARNAFRVGLRLAGAGVDAARPLAVIERRRPWESFLILETVEALDLRRYLLSRLADPMDPAARGRCKASLWRALGRELARLHQAGVRQRDLKALNVLVAGNGGAPPRVVFVDLESMQILKARPSRSVRARDLARLAVSLRTAELRALGVGDGDWEEVVGEYLAAWSVARRQGPGDELAWWLRTTRAWAGRKEARARRRGRPLF